MMFPRNGQQFSYLQIPKQKLEKNNAIVEISNKDYLTR